jgi:hypothetical protein
VLSCALVAGSPGAHAAPRRARAIANPFGQDMFGIATDGAMQNEGHRTLIRDLNDDAAVGAKWLRVDLNWAQIQAVGSWSYDWTPIDTLVKAAEARGMQVLGVLIYTPAWAAARRSCRLGDCAPKTADFARFATVAVAHYAALGVNAYEVWSEENSTAQWLPRPSPAAYTRLLKASYPLMKAEDPGATAALF